MTAQGRDALTWAPAPRARLLLGLAAVAVAFAAADTYVVVLALPDMMSSVGLAVDELQRAAPIVSGFLLGYVAMLPLIGRIADLRGRLPVLVGSLVVFALGSLVTAAAYDLPSMVTGRFLQGVGGGGLVPATLALVADMYPPSRRGVPLGVVGAVQELGSVVGPLYGAAVLALADWEEIFWINLAAGLVLAAVLHGMPAARAPSAVSRRTDLVAAALAVLAVGCLALVMLEPSAFATDVDLGLAFLPVLGESRWLSPLGITFLLLVVAFGVRCWFARQPLVDVRRWRSVAAQADLPGAALLALALGGIIVAFATADPEVHVFSAAGPWLLLGSAVTATGFWWHNRRSRHPLVPHGAFARTPAWGALAVSFFVGAALIAALVDIPIFARITVYPDSQLMAALVLVRLLVALPVGALLGGYLTRTLPAGVITAAGMLLAAAGFGWMATWGLTSLQDPLATVPLLVTGLGFGLALAPVNAALLAATADAVHGVTSALLVVARMVGMLVGISALTTIGLRRYYAVQVGLPAPADVCDTGTRCSEYTALLKEAGLAQLQTVFVGAAVCAVAAGVLALVTFRTAQTRGIATAEALRQAG
ncbi:MAG TPA: MFS transporter [Nocardioidaceae bacterium]|nr:MFS transporter [Nocardioidaceae bacterium]